MDYLGVLEKRYIYAKFPKIVDPDYKAYRL